MSEQGIVQLEIKDISLTFGGLDALKGISLEVKHGEILAVIGPNGAGKTCLFNCINGFYVPNKGQIYFEGREITKLPPYKIAQLGVSRTFQNVELYTGLSVMENMMVGRHALMKSNVLTGMFYYGQAHREEIRHRRKVEQIIDFLEIEQIREQVVGTLSYGMRQRVQLGRALALEPKVLLVDETMAGMNLEEKEDMARFILDVHDEEGITIILVEHDMGVVMDIAERVVVLDFGEKIAEGPPEEIKVNPAVIKAYLGAA